MNTNKSSSLLLCSRVQVYCYVQEFKFTAMFKSSSLLLCSSCPSCISCITDMRKIKSDVAVMQKQIKSSNNVIQSTNSIINSISNLLETLLEEFEKEGNVDNEVVLVTHESVRDEVTLHNSQEQFQPNKVNLHANHAESQKLFPNRVGAQELHAGCHSLKNLNINRKPKWKLLCQILG